MGEMYNMLSNVLMFQVFVTSFVFLNFVINYHS